MRASEWNDFIDEYEGDYAALVGLAEEYECPEVLDESLSWSENCRILHQMFVEDGVFGME